MVREEYLRLWDLLKDAHDGKQHYEGLVVTGQPGTGAFQAMSARLPLTTDVAGKTRFLDYAFARALRERIPVAFCTSPGEYYFCDGTGCRLYPTAHLVLHDVEPGKYFLALVDSNESVKIPPHTFIDRSQRCYTVQAASPRPGRWCNWTEERPTSEFWVTALWTRDEIRKLQ